MDLKRADTLSSLRKAPIPHSLTRRRHAPDQIQSIFRGRIAGRTVKGTEYAGHYKIDTCASSYITRHFTCAFTIHNPFARKLLNATVLFVTIPFRLPSHCPAPRNSHEDNTVTRVLAKPESTDCPPGKILRRRDLIYTHSHRSHVIVVTHAMTQDPQARRISHFRRDSAVRPTQKLGISDLHHVEKVMHGGGRQNTVYFCTLREKEKERQRGAERGRQSFTLQVRTWMSRFTVRRSRV